ncbi:MAG: uroporphyrinogen-III synthase [Chitinophagaceae bacterium]|nr:uroporphyrinogen-III synthase [Chitinophagaceae bacterium]
MSRPVRILSTRPLEAALIEQAAEKGIIIDVIPFIVTSFVKSEKDARQMQALALRPQVAIFTSGNAVEAVAGLLQQQGMPGQLPWKIFCISGATRRQVQEQFGEETIAGTAPSAEQLAGVILQPQHRHYPGTYFFYCGDLRRRELRDKLYKEAAIYLNEYIVYHTIQTPQIVTGHYDGIAFFSPSAVESYFSVNTPPPATTVLAIGNTTADAIRTHCLNPVIVSTVPEQRILVQQMIDYFSK